VLAAGAVIFAGVSLHLNPEYEIVNVGFGNPYGRDCCLQFAVKVAGATVSIPV